MTSERVLNFIKSLKIKNRKGHDGLHQQILKDEIDQLINPVAVIFKTNIPSKLYSKPSANRKNNTTFQKRFKKQGKYLT